MKNLPENLKNEIWEEELLTSIGEKIHKVLSETTVEKNHQIFKEIRRGTRCL